MSAETLLSVGIDLGTTTTQLVFSRLTVRNEGSAFSVPNYTVAAREVLRRSAVHFTPLRSERELDAEAIARIVDAEYAAAGIDRRAVQTGAVIITGETARRMAAGRLLPRPHLLPRHASSAAALRAAPCRGLTNACFARIIIP